MGSMIGIVVTVVVLITVGGALFVVFKLLAHIHGKQQATQKLLATGIPGTARVREQGPTGTRVSVMGQRSIEVTLALEVNIPGRAPYMTQVTQFISEMLIPAVLPGSIVSVRVDPNDPNAIAIAGPANDAASMGGGPMIHRGAGGGGWGGAPGAGGMVIQPTAGAAPGGGPAGGWGAPPPGVPGVPGVPVGGWGALPPGGPTPFGGAGFAGPDMGKAMKRSMTMTIVIMLITTVPIAIIMAAVFVDWSALGIDVGGSDDDGKSGDIPKGGYCEGTARCCKVVFGNAASANCDSWKSLPAAGCKSTWESYSQTAKAQGKSCK